MHVGRCTAAGLAALFACLVGCQARRSSRAPDPAPRAQRAALVGAVVGEPMPNARVTAIGDDSQSTKGFREAPHDATLHYVGVDVARAFDRVVFFPSAHADR